MYGRSQLQKLAADALAEAGVNGTREEVAVAAGAAGAFRLPEVSVA